MLFDGLRQEGAVFFPAVFSNLSLESLRQMDYLGRRFAGMRRRKSANGGWSMRKSILLWAALLPALAAIPVVAGEKASLPKGYEKWAKSKQKIVTDKNSLFYGIHYIYADKKALTAYKGGGKYPEGSQFVVTYYNIREEGGKPAQGKKNMIVIMRKDKRQQATGGWLFAGFTAEGKPSGLDPVKNCYECHLKEAQATDLVISKYADFK